MTSEPPAKPAYDSPCNGCGLCCRMEVCDIGLQILPEAAAPCPMLRFDGARYRCRVVEMEAASNAPPLIAQALGIGLGCDSYSPEHEPK